jgi:hypothetical protein
MSRSTDTHGGSRRRRLWELDTHAHCPVIGVCLPIAAIRRLVGKACGGQAIADDYELHCGVIAECRLRTPLAEHVQKALDTRYALALQRATRLKTDAELAAWWHEQATGCELPGAFWAVLTHSRCTPALEHRVLGEVHMLQHQVGVATRAERGRLDTLVDENGVLARLLAEAQARAAQQAAQHARDHDELQRVVVRLRAEALLRTTESQGLREELRKLQAVAPSLPARLALVAQNRELLARVQDLQHRSTQLEDRLLRLHDPARRHAQASVAPVASDQGRAAVAEPSPPVQAERAVLCVGGRTASVPAYRRLIEGTGNRFLHHDGGEEDSAARLDATLAAADLVICQTGCISHDAYWRVKDHCRRTGKRCVFVGTPSRHALAQALASIDGRRSDAPPQDTIG